MWRDPGLREQQREGDRPIPRTTPQTVSTTLRLRGSELSRARYVAYGMGNEKLPRRDDPPRTHGITWETALPDYCCQTRTQSTHTSNSGSVEPSGMFSLSHTVFQL